MNRLLLTVALLAALAAPIDQEVRLDAEAQRRAGITVAAVAAMEFSDELRVVGEITRASGSTLTVRTVLHGHVESIHVAPGDAVRRGDVLLEIHSHELQSLHAGLLTLVREQRLAASLHQAGLELLEVDGISRLEVDRRELELEGLRVDRQVLETTLIEHGQTQEEIDRIIATGEPDPMLRVEATRSGIVLELPVQADAWLAELEPLVVIGDPDRVELHLQLPPDDAATVSRGDLVDYAPVGRPLNAGRAQVITRVPQVDPDTRMVTIRCELLDRRDAMIPGVLIEGTIQRGGVADVPAVPADSITRIGGSDVIFVQTGTELFSAREVLLGPVRGGLYPVLDGVQIGERIVTGGVFLLKSALVRATGSEQARP